MKNIYLNIRKANSFNLKKAKKIVENNNLVGLPTETVYGLAGSAYSSEAVKKIFKFKKRSLVNPLIIHFKNLKDTKNDIIHNNSLIKLYNALCPGPITFILNKKTKSNISKIATAGKKTVAVRFPQHKIAQSFLKILNVPLAAPSGNISTKLSPTCANDLVDEFGKKLEYILDGGQCKIGLESTIIDLTGKPTILRQGAINTKKISKILKRKISINKKTKSIKSPGQLKYHYSPGIPIFMNKIKAKKGGAFITFGKKFKSAKNHFNLSKSYNLKIAAGNLYKTMRKIKNQNFKSISICKIPNVGIGKAINERLKKASNK